MQGGGPRVVVSIAAFHARVRGSVPGLGGLKETENVSSPSTCGSQYCGEPPWPRGSVLGSDRQGSNFESCVWRTVSSQSFHHPQKILLAQFSLYVHEGGLKPDSFHFNLHALVKCYENTCPLALTLISNGMRRQQDLVAGAPLGGYNPPNAALCETGRCRGSLSSGFYCCWYFSDGSIHHFFIMALWRLQHVGLSERKRLAICIIIRSCTCKVSVHAYNYN